MRKNNNIAIIGGLGHVGLPLGLLFANKNFKVTLIDTNISNKNLILKGKMPFFEIDGDKYLKNALKKNNIKITDQPSVISESHHIIICIGTPIDEYLNPKTNLFLKSLNNYIKFFSSNHNIIIRSSVYPGICDILFENLKRKKFIIFAIVQKE